MKIWQTWRSTDMPERMVSATSSWTELNPDYDYRFYDDNGMEEYVHSYDCSDFSFDQTTLIRAFQRLVPPAARADLFRYLLLYEKGGVYADIDTVCLQPLSTLIAAENDAVLGFESLNQFNTFIQWAMAIVPKHAFLKATLERTVRNIDLSTFDFDFRHVFCLTGPVTMTCAIHDCLGLEEDFNDHQFGDLSLGNTFVRLYDRHPFREFIQSKYPGYEEDQQTLGIKKTFFLPIFVDE